MSFHTKAGSFGTSLKKAQIMYVNKAQVLKRQNNFLALNLQYKKCNQTKAKNTFKGLL